MIIFDVLKLRWRLLLRSCSARELWTLAVSIMVAFSCALIGLLYFLAWLDTYHPKAFTILLVGGSISFIAATFFVHLLRLLKLQSERYRQEVDRS